MTEAIRRAGAEPRLIRVFKDLSIDIDHASEVVDFRTSAMLVPHYFGIPQNAERIRGFCEDNSLTLLQDCAHVLPSADCLERLANLGDYVILSAPKFYPTDAGGFLMSATRNLATIKTCKPSLSRNVKALANTLEESANFGRFWPLHGLIAGCARLGTRAASVRKSIDASHESDDGDRPEKPDDPRARTTDFSFSAMSFVDSTIVRWSDNDQIARKRRANFQLMLDELSDLETGRPLLGELPVGIVPYMFPLIVDGGEHTFSRLKQHRVPIYRWDNLDSGDCAISRHYSETLLQLPCHQSLRPSEIDWIVSTIREELDTARS
jgi:dTDP-4-amino-4,6-dideoxygalactose transaminase